MNESTLEQHCHGHHLRRISWTAILVGALTAIGLGFLLNLFGIAIGLAAIKSIANGSSSLAIGGFLGLIVGIIASMLAAGYAAGYLGRHYNPRRNLGIVYGFTTWVVALILSALIIGSLSQYAVTYTKAISNVAATSMQQNKEGSSPTMPATENNNLNMATGATALVSSAFVVFVLFFISAFFTCLGACWGMSCKRDD
jgi:hypothetical protein